MIDTRIYTPKDLQRKTVQDDIRQTLLSGKNVVFPTETVYGIGAFALSEKGVRNIYSVKGRPSDNPLIVHVRDVSELKPYIHIDQPYVEALIDAFWPGPLTLVFRRKQTVPDNITGGLETVGTRVPSHPVAREILSIAGVPVCAPSANISGRPSSTLFEHVLEDFNHTVDIIIDGGKSDVGLESTVLDVTKKRPVILRPGVITRSMIEAITPPVTIATEAESEEKAIPKAPGMKYRHYAPEGRLTIVEGDAENVIAYINEQTRKHQEENERVGVITTGEHADAFDTPYVFNIGESADEAAIASNLYIALRTMDQLKIDHIYSFSFHKGRYKEAIMNRLYKAANHRIIRV